MYSGERLKEERERLGFNQTQFAAIGGVQRRSQSSYENGDRSPDMAYLEAIVQLGVDAQYILTGTRSSMALSPEEQLMLDRYRASPRELRDAALRVLLGADIPDKPGNSVQGSVAEGAQIAQGSGIVQVSTGRRTTPTKKN